MLREATLRRELGKDEGSTGVAHKTSSFVTYCCAVVASLPRAELAL